MVRYITGVSSAGTRAIAHQYDLGLLVTPDTAGYIPQISAYPYWAADNACFNHPERFVTANYLRWLEEFTAVQRRNCLFATAPDVVGNAVATLERSLPVLPQIRDRGFLACLVGQDGLESLTVPWDDFDVFFIGGSTEWKLSPAARKLTAEARRRGKWTHMGRVNSYRRLKLADDFGCHTADGTYLRFGPETNLPKMLNWFDKLKAANAAAEALVA